MIETSILKALAAAAMMALPCVGAAAERAAIVPMPAEYVMGEGAIALPQQLTVGGDMADEAVGYLMMRGYDASAALQPTITANVDTLLAAESYTLEVAPDGISVKAADGAGLMYAIETLTQLIDQAEGGNIAACRIADSPRYGYRGAMLDVVRCYLPIDEVKKIVDVASRLKLNKLHLHLTDDNGWRMQIKKYPKLTEVGAWRVDREELFPGRANPKEGEPTTYGGYYTQDELRGLVDYAAQRNVEVIPEIEMPAHAIAAIASYPELTCPVNDEFIGVLPGIGGNAASIILCAGNDSTIAFVKNVLDEVMDVFPSQYIHLGGDEANKSRWEKCDRCKQRIAEEDLNDFEELQGWFMDQINAYVRSKGKTAIGWDEVTYGKPKEDMIIMGWQGTGAVAEKYAKETGRRFIMTPAKSTYLIRYQGPQWFEPFTYFGNITLRDAYEFEPVKDYYTDAMRDQLWGIQGSMWTEFCRTPADVQYMMFPRLIAIADAAWRPEGARDWDNFVTALDSFLPRLEKNGMTYAKSMYNIQHTAMPQGDGTVEIVAENIRPDAVIMVADNEQMANAQPYAAPIKASKDKKLCMQTSVPSGAKGEVLKLDLRFNAATGRIVECDSCSNGLGYALLNGVRGSDRNSDFEWAGWYDRQARFTVDLGKVMPVRTIKLGVLANANMNAALPARVQVQAAGDDGKFKTIKTIEIPENERFPLNAEVTDLDFGKIKTKARFLRFVADNGGNVPDGMPRECNATWLYFDEVIVN